MRNVLLVLGCIAVSFSVGSCSMQKKAEETAQKPAFKLEDVGGDQTDVFAIPLDTSEEEEAIEMRQLNKMSKEERAARIAERKAKAAKKAEDAKKQAKPAQK